MTIKTDSKAGWHKRGRIAGNTGYLVRSTGRHRAGGAAHALAGPVRWSHVDDRFWGFHVDEWFYAGGLPC